MNKKITEDLTVEERRILKKENLYSRYSTAFFLMMTTSSQPSNDSEATPTMSALGKSAKQPFLTAIPGSLFPVSVPTMMTTCGRNA